MPRMTCAGSSPCRACANFATKAVAAGLAERQVRLARTDDMFVYQRVVVRQRRRNWRLATATVQFEELLTRKEDDAQVNSAPSPDTRRTVFGSRLSGRRSRYMSLTLT
jgi:hypothetical protein